jgi:hypothetical protein
VWEHHFPSWIQVTTRAFIDARAKVQVNLFVHQTHTTDLGIAHPGIHKRLSYSYRNVALLQSNNRISYMYIGLIQPPSKWNTCCQNPGLSASPTAFQQNLISLRCPQKKKRAAHLTQRRGGQDSGIRVDTVNRKRLPKALGKRGPILCLVIKRISQYILPLLQHAEALQAPV